jgi:transcriptional regulator with XRE-family HTH domain
MTFGEKVKSERTKLNITQADLAARIGVSRRIITSYENNQSFPRSRETYKKLAEIFGIDVNYLLTEDESFELDAREKYGSRGAKQAHDLIEQMGGLFAGGSLSDEDIDGVMRAMQDLYWKAKEENKKYTPKMYQK